MRKFAEPDCVTLTSQELVSAEAPAATNFPVSSKPPNVRLAELFSARATSRLLPIWIVLLPCPAIVEPSPKTETRFTAFALLRTSMK